MSRWHCLKKKTQRSCSLIRRCTVATYLAASRPVDGCPTVTLHACLLLLPTEGTYARKWGHRGNLRWIVRPSLGLGFRSFEDLVGRGLGRWRQTVTDEGLFRKEAATVPLTIHPLNWKKSVHSSHSLLGHFRPPAEPSRNKLHCQSGKTLVRKADNQMS